MFSTTAHKQNEPLSKKEKIELLKVKHEPIFQKLGLADVVFIPKMIFGSPSIFYLFPGEIKGEKDIYIEKTSKEFEPEDPNRTLYKWTFNPNYKKDYDVKPVGATGDNCYIIPFDTLTKVEIDEADEFDLPNPHEDLPISELTIRDLTAILTGKPVSFKPWLNKIIK